MSRVQAGQTLQSPWAPYIDQWLDNKEAKMRKMFLPATLHMKHITQIDICMNCK